MSKELTISNNFMDWNLSIIFQSIISKIDGSKNPTAGSFMAVRHHVYFLPVKNEWKSDSG
jgi:hypothetical protein